MENTPKRIIAIIVISFLIVGVITIFPVKIIQTTENGQHTGIVTAVETNGVIWKTNRVFFKTDAQSSQEDVYCVIDPAIKLQLIDYQKAKKEVTIFYDDYMFIGQPLCKGEEGGIITGVLEVM